MTKYTLTLTPETSNSNEPVQKLTHTWTPEKPWTAELDDTIDIVFNNGKTCRTVELIMYIKNNASPPSRIFNGAAYNGNGADGWVTWKDNKITTDLYGDACEFTVLVLYTALINPEPISPTITTVYRADPEIIVGKKPDKG